MDPVRRAVEAGDDLYAILGVDARASDDDIRHAYRALARVLHPDVHPPADQAALFGAIAAAYEVLGDEGRRAAYDRALALERMAAARAVNRGPIAAHAAPRPTGAVASRGRAASTNPADHRAGPTPPARPPRQPIDEWRLVSVFARVAAAVVLVVLLLIAGLIVASADAEEPARNEPTIYCRTPDGWYDCWEATSPDGPGPG